MTAKREQSIVRILGIDPGSRITGYGCVEWNGNRKLNWVTDGVLRLASTSGRATIPLEKRLLDLFHGLESLIQEFSPHVIVVERVFFAKNAVSALKLGQARGIALLVGALRKLPIVEFSPTQVKLAVVGAGRADKAQVAKMVQIVLGKKDFATSDASDALALAIAFAQGLNPSSQQIQGSLTLQELRAPKRNSSLADALAHRIPFDVVSKS